MGVVADLIITSTSVVRSEALIGQQIPSPACGATTQESAMVRATVLRANLLAKMIAQMRFQALALDLYDGCWYIIAGSIYYGEFSQTEPCARTLPCHLLVRC